MKENNNLSLEIWKEIICLGLIFNAWANIECFKEQKNCDLKEAFLSFAVMQISMCKKGIHVWTNAKECFSKM